MTSSYILTPHHVKQAQANKHFITTQVCLNESELIFEYNLQHLNQLIDSHNQHLGSQTVQQKTTCISSHIQKRKDYLWEGNCMELFVGSAEQANYLEININFANEWNAYHFTGYRTPNCMPPPPANIDKLKLTNHTDISKNHQLYKYGINTQWITKLLGCENTDKLIFNICCVIVNSNTQAFYAHQHASPADFHNQSTWLKLQSL